MPRHKAHRVPPALLALGIALLLGIGRGGLRLGGRGLGSRLAQRLHRRLRLAEDDARLCELAAALQRGREPGLDAVTPY